MGPGDDPVQNGRRIFNAKCIKVVTAMSTPLEPVLGLPATYGQERDAVLSEGEWETLVESIISTRCTPFIGAGVAAPPLPLGRDLARQLAEGYRYPLTDTFNLPRVAQYVSIIRSLASSKGKLFGSSLTSRTSTTTARETKHRQITRYLRTSDKRRTSLLTMTDFSNAH
jgi:hypothetical protein